MAVAASCIRHRHAGREVGHGVSGDPVLHSTASLEAGDTVVAVRSAGPLGGR